MCHPAVFGSIYRFRYFFFAGEPFGLAALLDPHFDLHAIDQITAFPFFTAK